MLSSVSFAFSVMPAEKTSTLTGYTRPVSTLTITAETGGRLTEVNLGMGDTSDGGVFAVVDPVFTKFSIKSVETSIAQAETAISRLENRTAYLKKEYDRVESLFLSEVETESRRDTVKQNLDQAVFALQEARLNKDSLEINLAQLREKLRRQYIKVPAGWHITSKPMEKGEMVAAGQPIAQAGDFRTLIVPLFVDSEQLSYLRSNETVRVLLEGAEVQAELNRVNPGFDERTRKREIELKLTGVRPLGGMAVQIPVVVPSEGFMVHKSAISSRYANPKVRLAGSGKEISVDILGKNGDMVIISASGLQVGDELQAVDR